MSLDRQHTRLSEAVKERLRVSIDGEDFPVHLTLDEAEGITRVLWEVVGHMGDDVGEKGYEFNLITRARVHLGATSGPSRLTAWQIRRSRSGSTPGCEN